MNTNKSNRRKNGNRLLNFDVTSVRLDKDVQRGLRKMTDLGVARTPYINLALRLLLARDGALPPIKTKSMTISAVA